MRARQFDAGDVLRNLPWEEFLPPASPRANPFASQILQLRVGATCWQALGALDPSAVLMRDADFRRFGNRSLVRRGRKSLREPRSRSQPQGSHCDREKRPSLADLHEPPAVLTIKRFGQNTSGDTPDLEDLITSYPAIGFLDTVYRALKFPGGRKRSRRKRPMQTDVMRLFTDPRWRKRTRIDFGTRTISVDEFLRNPKCWQEGEGVVYQPSGEGVSARAVYRFDSRWIIPGLAPMMRPYVGTFLMIQAEQVQASLSTVLERIG